MSDSHQLAPLVRRWAKHSRLSAEDEAAILALPFTRRVFGREEYMVREGEQSAECCLIIRGFAFRQKLLRSGARQILSFHIPTEFVDLQNTLLRVSDHSVQSLGRCETAVIPKATLIELARTRPAVGEAMWIDTLVDSSVFREWVVNVGRRGSKTRIAHLLCELVLRLRWSGAGTNDKLEFPLTQEQLADATGLTAVHTNRTLQALRRDGLIQLNSGMLKVVDWDRLADVGDFEAMYLHNQP